MRRSSRMLAAGAGLVAIGSFVACGGSSSTTPATSHTPIPVTSPTPTGNPTATPTPAKPSPTPSVVPTATPTPAPIACVNQALPGTYTTMVALGSYNPSTGSFDGDLAASSYTVTKFSPSNATPPPTPTPGPTQTPLNIPVYLWSGVYTVSTGPGPIAKGCFDLITTQNGSPLPGGNDSGASEAFPQFAGQFTLQILSYGQVTALEIATSATGGIGNFSLDNQTTGNITLGPRQSLNLSAATRALKAVPNSSRLPF